MLTMPGRQQIPAMTQQQHRAINSADLENQFHVLSLHFQVPLVLKTKEYRTSSVLPFTFIIIV